jgi:hypothetical protein
MGEVDPARAILLSMRAELDQRLRDYDTQVFVDSLEATHRQTAKLLRTVAADLQRGKERTADSSLFYRWLSYSEARERLHPDTFAEAYETFTSSMHDLGLCDLPLYLRWFEAAPDGREPFLAGDELYFSHRNDGILRGCVDWRTVLLDGVVAVNVGLSYTTAQTVAHELRHVQQRRIHGPATPDTAIREKLETEAEAYAERVYQSLRIRRSTEALCYVIQHL